MVLPEKKGQYKRSHGNPEIRLAKIKKSYSEKGRSGHLIWAIRATSNRFELCI